MTGDLIARATTEIGAPVSKVWDALVNPETIKQYMFGTTVSSDWREGSPITWKGEWKGKQYEDKGTILRVDPRKALEYSHFSPLTGAPDRPENYHTVSIELTDLGNHTVVKLSQNNNSTEEGRQHSEKNWSAMLESLKKLLESRAKG